MGQEVLIGGDDSENPLQLITAHQPKLATSTAVGSQVKKPAPGQSKPAAVVAQPAAKLPSRPPPLAVGGLSSRFVIILSLLIVYSLLIYLDWLWIHTHTYTYTYKYTYDNCNGFLLWCLCDFFGFLF